jgi:ATP-dependent DNA helicase RecQ
VVERIKEVLKQYWGYRDFLPLQREAIETVTQGRDAVVVLPTGGGKSLCYQVPAMILSGLTVVVSPLISLMKDQVDALTECGVSAARIDSSLTPTEQDNVFQRLHEKTFKLLYVSPERLMMEGFTDLLKKNDLSLIAIDEAHCISMWGHDFRPEYRQLGSLKNIFPGVTIGAYTATATAQVRSDIAEQLYLDRPRVLVGSFDRPNLVYSVRPRVYIVKQVCEVLDRHKNESGIVYCIRRSDVEDMCAALTAQGYRAAPYHAGMHDKDRKHNQEAFIQEKINTIVATIAFGMGIDKSNVRYVIHTGMPKSIEHYQQESGRAGRDSLEAECVLFYSGGDYGVWKHLTKDMGPEARDIALAKLGRLYGYCTGGVCRHRALLEYFGQDYNKPQCEACDICLGQLDLVENSLVTGQKILSCILRLEQRFGAGYTASILTGSREARILENGHDQLTTYGLLSHQHKRTVHDWIEQLTGQGYIEKTGEYNTLTVTNKGWDMLKGKQAPRLLRLIQKPAQQKVAQVSRDSWEGVDRCLFEALRVKRAKIAGTRHMPAYVVFGDAALRDMARKRPNTTERFLEVKGVGQAKCRQYGTAMINTITEYCEDQGIDMNVVTDGAF